MRANAAPVRDPAGKVALALLLLDEITDLDSLRDRLAHSEKLAQSRRLETIGRLAGGVAHDFNNLLTVIIGFAQLIRDDKSLNSHLQAQIDIVIQSANRGATLTSQLLAFSRKQPIQLRKVDLNVLVARVGAMLRRLVPEHIELTLDLTADRCDVMADPTQMEQVIMNLVSNAGDAVGDRGRVTLQTRLVETMAGSGDPQMLASLAVIDNGHGMTDEVREHMFEPFFTTKEFGRGTGLGLASVFGTVKQHSGEIVVQSAVGAGTRVEILLAAVIDAEESPIAAAVRGQGGTETILLVEDEPYVRSMTRLGLEGLGYRVLEAANGVEALEIYREHSGVVDLLLTDAVMPEMHGLALLQHLRKFQPGIKAAFISGYPRDVIGEFGALDQHLHFLQKPFTFPDLDRLVREALRS